ncbi:3-oxoacid CoA-transferase subunit A [uncultured Sphingomonas sp.]|uniref:3-oxoacid CoA-transferase subunit A n=1 Tax=uncultured Sphingomonas sp. TaxID=158754 RepID=UPI0026338C07|nr:3-oxoacid CoA-transferase subunit A [uncultured Sphingomonas sp.]
MIDKRFTLAEALRDIADGATVMIGGFGAVGQPDFLVNALADQGATDLTVIANNAGWNRETGIPKLLDLGRVRKIVCSFPKNSPAFDDLFRVGKIELEIVPQGTLAERIRAAGAGVPGFYTATGVGTQMAEGKETRMFGGKEYLLEEALHADVALIEAWRGDRWGNLSYRGSGRNFNPVMAMAATCTIAQVHEIVELGEIAPDAVVTPGIFVNRIVAIPAEAKA